MMNALIFYAFCIILCGAINAHAEEANLQLGHHLIKSQANDYATNRHQHTPSAPQRQFVSSDEVPYFVYQPPVSVGKGLSTRRQATSHLSSIRGYLTGRQANSPPGPGYVRDNLTSNTGPRGRTYAYPFGRERVQYTGSQQQGYPNQAQGPSGSRYGTDEQLDSVQHQKQDAVSRQQKDALSRQQHVVSLQQDAVSRQQDAVSQQQQDVVSRQQQDAVSRQQQDAVSRQQQDVLSRQQQDALSRRQQDVVSRQQQDAVSRQQHNPFYSTPSQRSFVHNNQNDSSQVPPIQQSSYDAVAFREQELRRRQDDLRRRHEDERRRQEEERRILIAERRRREEEKRRQYYEQHQRVNQHRLYGKENSLGFRPNVTRNEQTGLPDNRQQRSSSQSESDQRMTSVDNYSQRYPHTTEATNQQGYQQEHKTEQTKQQGYQQVHRTEQTNQQGYQQVLTNRPSKTHNISQQPQGSIPHYEQPVHGSSQRESINQQPAYIRNSTHHSDVHTMPNQQPGYSQVYYRQPGLGDSRFHPSPFVSNNSNSNSEQSSEGQGYPHQVRKISIGSSFTYEQQDNDSDCPETGIDLRINGLDCRQAVLQYGSYLCYTHEYTSRDCCQVCKHRKQPLRTGCGFGDHAELCSSIAPSDCYDLRNRYSCCQTCERLRKNNLPVGCEYGDMTVRCENVRQNPGLCYIPDNQRLCCETCSQIRNDTSPGCPWGDYNPNLCQLFEENSSTVRINCYSHQRRKLCCQTCERLREWIADGLPADCQFGDKPVIFTTSQFGRLNCSNLFSYFSLDECRTNEDVAKNCCQTCHRLINSRG